MSESFDPVLSGDAPYLLLNGASEQLLDGLPDNSISLVLTDPPYGLGDDPDPADLLAYMRGEEVDLARRDFLGKAWQIPTVTMWRRVFRVLRPGGHLAVFAGSRTWDIMSIGIRLAGFECRDTIRVDGPVSFAWVTAQAMPHGTNLSKAIDAAAGADREVVGKYAKPDGSPLVEHRDPNADRDHNAARAGLRGNRDLTAPSTHAATSFDGWNTALRPSHEPILLFRKPLAEVASETIHAVTGWSYWCSRRQLWKADQMAPWKAQGFVPRNGQIEEDGDNEPENRGSGYSGDEAARRCPSHGAGVGSPTGDGGSGYLCGCPFVTIPNLVPHFILEQRRALHAGVDSVTVLYHGTEDGGEAATIIAREPFRPWSTATVAANALVYGTGGINVEACRVKTTENLNGGAYAGTPEQWAKRHGKGEARDGEHRPDSSFNGASAFATFKPPSGRWPANYLMVHSPWCVPVGVERVKTNMATGGHEFQPSAITLGNKIRIAGGYAEADGREAVMRWECRPGCAVANLDKQTGYLRDRGNKKATATPKSNSERSAGTFAGFDNTLPGYEHCNDGGGPASRFFPTFGWEPGEFEEAVARYVPKVPPAERHAGCDDLFWARDSSRPSGLRPVSPEEWEELPKRQRGLGNLHVCVKPQSLLRWVVRLLCPPGGVVLDIYSGSGSTVAAAVREGFPAIGFERDPDYHLVGTARAEHALAEREGKAAPRTHRPRVVVPSTQPQPQLSLF